MDHTLRSLVSPLFIGSPSRTTRVGIEQELLVSDGAGATVPIPLLRLALRGSAGEAHLGFEPGGQVELSLPPAPCPAAAALRLHATIRDARDRLGRTGIQLRAAAVDTRPEKEVPLRLRTARYLQMQRHFDTIGPAGRRMMRRTAATQVCVDWWPGRAGGEQWQALNLAAPFLAGAFARSTGPRCRLDTWLSVDPSRTGFDGRLLHGDDPVTAYTCFAAGATRFVDGDAAHLTTLFPPVRPRGRYLEIRFLDAQDGPDVDDAVAAVAAIAYDEERRRRTLRLLTPLRGSLGELWALAAAGDPATVALGREIAGRSDVEPAA